MADSTQRRGPNMATHDPVIAPVLRPSRLNAAGRCLHCLGAGCDSARCIEMHAQAVWELCSRCGGTEYVNGHVSPATASTRCNCFGGVVEAGAADVMPVAPLRKSNRGGKAPAPHVVTPSGLVFYAGS